MFRFKRRLFNYVLLLQIIIKKIFKKNYVFMLGTPIHGNIGDQAIIYSEVKFFKEIFGIDVIEVESFLVKTKFNLVKLLVGKSPIFVHGGGFLGSLWIEEEEMFRTILKNFKDNRIIVFPQTCYFDLEDKSLLSESQLIYSSHKNLTFFVRERFSYEFMRNYFPDCDVRLVPDIVLFNKVKNFNKKKNDVLFCLRNDKEKKENNIEIVKDFLKKFSLNFFYTDTVIGKKVFKFNREKIVSSKIEQFSNYKLVITDRLHGMVFAYLSKSPCLVFENSSYKVKGLYEWIKNCNYIKLYNKDTVKSDIEYLISLNSFESVNDNELNFNELIDSCREVFNCEK